MKSKDKAQYNHVSLDNVVLCRMNALEIALADESVDVVVAEIYRVLKKGGGA